MEKQTPFLELAGYIRYRIGIIVALALACLCFILLSFLSGPGLSMALYGTLICCFAGILAAMWDFGRYHARRKALLQAYCNVENMVELLPVPANSIEEGYREIVSLLSEDRAAAASRASSRESEMSDYYTLWVHQIKTPIAAMRLLLEEYGQGEERYALEQELFRIEQYAEMVLHYLRVSGMSEDMLICPYDLYDIARQAVKKYSMSFINSKLSLKFEEFSCRILTDEKWLAVVIEQLLSNCVKYTKAGGVTIRMEQVGTDKVLLIRDTGIGIREEDLPRIFERGFTGYNGRMDKKSTGIGLYLVKRILDRLSLRITAESGVGKGTSFRIYIPKDCQVEKEPKVTEM